MAEHKGPGHGDVTLSLSEPMPDGGYHHRSWTICACSALMARLDQLLGPPAHETTATAEAFRLTAEAVRNIPGAVHLGKGM